MQVPQPPELIHLTIPLILLPPPNAESLNELAKVENADPTAIMSVQFDPDGRTIVSGGYSGTLKVWSAGRLARTPPAPHRSHDPLWIHVCCRQNNTHVPLFSPHPDTLQLVEERKGDGSALDASGSGAVAECDGATLRLKEGGGVFYAPGPLWRASRCTGPGSSRARSRVRCTTWRCRGEVRVWSRGGACS